jgi:hypothetical protein
MTLLRLLAAVLLFSTTAAFATDKTDLYYIPSESGWGMTIANQGDTIFVTMYVYDSARLPTWFVGTGALVSTDSQGVNLYGGDWYSVRGPYYGAGSFDPNTVAAVKVGAFTYRELTVTTGQVSYSVNGINVTKTVQRQTLQNNPYVNGNYAGAYFSSISGCPVASSNGTIGTFIAMTASGTPAATTFTIALQDNSGAFSTICTASGPYTQAGRMGTVTGTWSCTGAINGNSTMFEIESGLNGISARFHNTFGGCVENGHFNAARNGS